MRMKAALIIIAIAFFITAANFGASLFLTNQTLKDTMSHDISLARDFVDDLMSTKISLLKSNAQTVSERLMKAYSPEEMERIMREQSDQFPDFRGFTVCDRQGIVLQYGDWPTDIEYPDNNIYLQYAFAGETVISTISKNAATGELSMYICTPLDKDHVLSVTIPGMIFSHLLEGKKIYETGQIFLLDEDGALIADYHTDVQEDTGTHFHENLIVERTHFSAIPKISHMLDDAEYFTGVLAGPEGAGNYSYNKEAYIYSYKRVSASNLGWSIIVTAPLSESPAANVRNSLVLLAVLFLITGAIVAVLISGPVVKPFKRIAEQNHRLEELNEISQAQRDKIQEAHLLTKLMMDATPICSMLWDENINIFDCNAGSVKLFGMKDKEDFLSRFFDLSPELQPNGRPSREMAAMYIQQAFKEGYSGCEWMHQLLDGTPIPCEMKLVRVSYDEGYIVAAYARDLREHKQMMKETHRLHSELEVALVEAQAANDAKSSFLARMSHEMRTPLNAVVGLSELILNNGGLNAEAEDRLEKIHISGMTLLGLVNDILDISKIESGKFELHPTEYDTPSLINDILSLNTVRIGEKPIKFELKVDEELPALLYGDDLRIKQIFNNLLSNAFKYTASGVVSWNMGFEREGDSVWLVSSVRDTGIGIKPEDMDKLFSDYGQVDTKTNRAAEGTGLGLAITKRLVKMMDGAIEMKSEYGKGTEFMVRFRQKHAADVTIGKETAQRLMSARYTASKRAHSSSIVRIDLSYANVLVVDDVPTNLDVMKGMLKPYGINVDCAVSGQQAIDMIRSQKRRYDAVFMDHMMPGMDGIEATRIIRQEIGTDYAQNVPVIALTANAISGNEQMFLENGFQAFISKPIDMMRLDSVLRQWVRDKEREKELPTKQGYCLLHGLGSDAKQQEAALDDFNDIDGLDIDAGLARFGGSGEAYIKVLRSYALNTRALLNNMKKHLATGNLPDYAIDVHGVKGSSRGAGATQAGHYAERLEQWAKKGDKEQVLAENGAFMTYVNNLLDSLDEALARYDLEHKKPAAPAPDPALIEELREACGEYDINRVDQAMLQLESFAYESGAQLVTWLRQQVDEMNFDEIYNNLYSAEEYAEAAL